MGCACNFPRGERKNEIMDDISKKVEEISSDELKLKSLIKRQRNIRSKWIILKLKSKNNTESNENQTRYTTANIEQENIKEELETLLKEYPPLYDGIILKINGPIKDNKYHYTYLGEWDFSKNVKHGRGIQYFEEGSKYYGYFIQDKANIKGKLIHSDGDIYEGGWLNNVPNGKGKYIHKDGTIYEGDWKEDKQHGKGKEKWPDGAWYEGDYFNGQKHGKGKFHWADGSSYEGDFSNNNINGYGYYIFGDKRTYKGTWVDNKLEGKGVFTWPDGRKYEGDYKKDKRDGYGTFYWSDGKIYKGNWKNGKQCGEGEFYDPIDKEWKKGFWYGNKVKWWNDELFDFYNLNHINIFSYIFFSVYYVFFLYYIIIFYYFSKIIHKEL